MKPTASADTFTLHPLPPPPANPVPHGFVPGRAAREEILHRAYALWEREGHPTDRKLANWLEAEAEVFGSPQTGRDELTGALQGPH